MRSWLSAVALFLACALCISAADYYARVPKDSKSFQDILMLAREGYLAGWTEPDYAMLRLEFAMLLQSALPPVFDAVDSGNASKEAAAAAERLVKEFKAELQGIGAQVRGVPAPAPVQASAHGDVLRGELLKAERVEAQLLVIEDEILTDSPAPGGQTSPESAVHNSSTNILIDELMEQQAGYPANRLQPVVLPETELWRNTGHDSMEFVAADVLVPATADQSMAEVASGFPEVMDEAVEMTQLPLDQPTRFGSPQDGPTAAANGAETMAQPEKLIPRPYRGQPEESRGSGTGGAGGRELNMLLTERSQQQSGRASFSDRDSPGPVGEYAVQDRALGPAQQYARRVALDVQPFLDAQGQLMFRDSDGSVVSGTSSDLRLYWLDAGLDFMHEDWGARIAVNFNDRSSEPKLHELWVEFRDSESGLYGRAGRSVMPFAERKGWFPTFSYARELGFTSANTIGLGWNQPGWGASAWVYDAPVETVGGGSSSLDELAINLSLMSKPDDYSDNSWRLAMAYMSELGGHERRLAAGPLAASVSGLNISAGYCWGDGTWSLNLDYTAALDGYNTAALDADGDGQGDKPSALALELVYSPDQLSFWGLRAEQSSQYAAAAGNRWGLLYGRWLSEQMLARLELSRSTFNLHSPGRSRELALTADLNLVF